MPQTPLTAVVANALAVSSFLGKFPLTAERPFFCVFEKKKNTGKLCRKFLRQQATVSVVCNGLAARLLYHRFTFSYYLPFYKPQSQKRLKHRLLRYLQTPLPWGCFFSANFRLTSERPLALFFDTKKHIQVVPEIFTATGDSVCCLQRIGNKSFAPFSHFPITYLFTNRKVKKRFKHRLLR